MNKTLKVVLIIIAIAFVISFVFFLLSAYKLKNAIMNETTLPQIPTTEPPIGTTTDGFMSFAPPTSPMQRTVNI